jgi:alkylated DNA repair dioxygenase AlkB
VADLFPPTTPTLPFAFPNGHGFEASWNDQSNGFDISVPGGELFYAEHFFNRAWSDRTFAYLQEVENADWQSIDWRSLSSEDLERIAFRNIRWKQDRMKLYGKAIPLPRLTAWYGDPGAAYTYSGIKSEPNPWTDGLRHIKGRIEEATGARFNCVLLNWYRDGRDSLSWHADDERELGVDPVIASANFGATRDFQLRRNDDPEQTINIPLKHGTLLVMRGALQEHWKHAVPKRAGVKESRFNLTFRYIDVEAAASSIKSPRRKGRSVPADQVAQPA